MTSFAHQDLMVFALSAGGWFVAGILLGAAYFVTLRWNVSLFTARQSLLLPLGLQVARFVLLAAVLTLVTSRFGALPLLAAAAGTLVTRTVIIRMNVPS